MGATGDTQPQAVPMPDLSWWQDNGPFAVFLLLALGAIVWLVTKVILARTNADKAALDARATADKAALDAREKTVAELNAQTIKLVQDNQANTLRLLQEGHAAMLRSISEQRAECIAERRSYEAHHHDQLEAVRAELKEARDQSVEIGSRAIRALASLGKRINIDEG